LTAGKRLLKLMVMKASVYFLAGLVFLAAAIPAAAQQIAPSGPRSAPAAVAAPAEPAGPQMLGEPGPDLTPQPIVPRDPPRVHVSIIPRPDSNFSHSRGGGTGGGAFGSQ
jgi:hypothetical protein